MEYGKTCGIDWHQASRPRNRKTGTKGIKAQPPGEADVEVRVAGHMACSHADCVVHSFTTCTAAFPKSRRTTTS
eukprot:6313818-Amphidinium_carterae.1